jgi:zinc transport system substrate-binding protein
MRLALASLAALALLASRAGAEVPRVLADTAPVHSLVALVMGDLGAPGLAVPSGTSPHDAGLTPSEAQALAEAELIVWTGPAFLPWMEDAIAALAPDAQRVALLESPGWEPLPARAGLHLHAAGEHGVGEHEAGHEEAGHEEAGHEEVGHEEAGHEEAGHDGPAHEGEPAHEEAGPADEAGPDDHARDEAAGAIDPHAWLDPAVAAAWVGTIAEALAAADPPNAAAYHANAATAAARLLTLREEMRARLGPLGGQDGSGGYAVGHDAYQYLERAAGLPANWAVARADGAAAAPGDVAALRDAVLAGEVSCLLLDAEADQAWAETLGEGAALEVATVDPDGVFLPPGPGLYEALIREMTGAIEGCLAP